MDSTWEIKIQVHFIENHKDSYAPIKDGENWNALTTNHENPSTLKNMH